MREEGGGGRGANQEGVGGGDRLARGEGEAAGGVGVEGAREDVEVEGQARQAVQQLLLLEAPVGELSTNVLKLIVGLAGLALAWHEAALRSHGRSQLQGIAALLEDFEGFLGALGGGEEDEEEEEKDERTEASRAKPMSRLSVAKSARRSEGFCASTSSAATVPVKMVWKALPSGPTLRAAWASAGGGQGGEERGRRGRRACKR